MVNLYPLEATLLLVLEKETVLAREILFTILLDSFLMGAKRTAMHTRIFLAFLPRKDTIIFPCFLQDDMNKKKDIISRKK